MYNNKIPRYLHKFNLFGQEVRALHFSTNLLLTYTVFVRSYVYLNSIYHSVALFDLQNSLSNNAPTSRNFFEDYSFCLRQYIP